MPTEGAVTGEMSSSGVENVQQMRNPGTEPRPAVPLVSKIPLKVCEKIWTFQYIDLTELLPESSKPAPAPLVLFKSGENYIVFDPKKM